MSKRAAEIPDVPGQERGERATPCGEESWLEVPKSEAAAKQAPRRGAGKGRVVEQGPERAEGPDRGEIRLSESAREEAFSDLPCAAPSTGESGLERGGAQHCVQRSGSPG